MDHLTQPEPINHNELKRLLCDIVDEMLDFADRRGASSDIISPERGQARRAALEDAKYHVYRIIDTAILNGDDS